MATKKSIGRTLAHIDVAANTLQFAFTKTFSTATGIIASYLSLRLLVVSGFMNSNPAIYRYRKQTTMLWLIVR
jgi:hypothetical protein